jgi:hypothetical protein
MFGNLFSSKNNIDQEFSDRKKDAFDTHLELSWKIESTYKKRDIDPNALKTTIDYCWKQILIADEAKKAWLKECDEIGFSSNHTLPTHKGYSQLCIIFERQKKFDEVIKLAKQAKEQGWNGDWDKRIERCEKKLQPLQKE